MSEDEEDAMFDAYLLDYENRLRAERDALRAQLERDAARIKELEKALLEASIPLEALLMAGTTALNDELEYALSFTRPALFANLGAAPPSESPRP